MLKLHFLNVADGDALLIEVFDGPEPFRMLVDTGREHPQDVDTVSEYLHTAGVTHLDGLVITHLHDDHAGGLRALFPHVVIDRLYAGYIPAHPGWRIRRQPLSPSTVQGMIACLNRWSMDVDRLKSLGCDVQAVLATKKDIHLTAELSADVIVPNGAMARFQQSVWDAMFAKKTVSVEQKCRASKARNPNSLRLRLRYAGCEIELAADCYGSEWDEEDLVPCDILKVPHHGDRKAVTERLIDKLRPSHAVISCGRVYLPRKDRPSAETIGRLQRCGARVWFTDAYPDGTQTLHDGPSVDFLILDDGRIVAPDELRSEVKRP